MSDLKTYPIRFIEPIQLTDGTLVQLRPIHPLENYHQKVYTIGF